jgi:hypothetical protein
MTAQRPVIERAVLAGVVLALVVVAFLAGHGSAGGRAPRLVVPGPSRTVSGITVGFADTRSGANAAAAHYLLELERAIDALSPERVNTVARLVASAREADAMDVHATSVIALEQSTGVPLRRIAIATNPVSFSPSTAVVTVLEEWIYAQPRRELVWGVERVSLVWRAGDWRVKGIVGAAPSPDESLTALRSQLEFPGAGDASVR